MKHLIQRTALATALVLALGMAQANDTPQTLPFSQNWANAGLITTNDDWSSVPGIVGYRGDGLAASTGANPQTILAADTPGVVDVNANQTNPNTFNTGGTAEFAIADPVVALTGSGTAQAPYLLINLNTTGQSSINVAYNLRDIDGSVDNAAQPVALQYRIGNSGNFTNLPAGFVADASSGPSLATLVTPVSVALPAAAENQPLVQVRIITTNAVGNDEWIGVDDISVTGSGVLLPALSINDVTQTEGDSGTTNFTFTVTLSEPAPQGGISFDIATSDDSALSGSDFDATSDTLTIEGGATTATFSVPVHGDGDLEINETFLVKLSGVSAGASISDGEGLGTITNDDVVITSIGAIQGSGELSTRDGQLVMTEGVVTAKRGNGFFLQSFASTNDDDPDPDGDAATSDGIFVFTAAVPSMVTVGDHARVTGTVDEFLGSAATPTTEIVSPAVDVLTSGLTLPAPVELTTALAGPDSLPDTLEHLEGMLVSVATGLVTAQTDGNISEPSATSSDANAAFEFVVTGVPRPFREPGLSILDPFPVPPAKQATIPYFDANQERIKAFPLLGTRLVADAGATVTGLVGALTYFGDSWELLYDVANPPVIGNATATAVSDAGANDITVGGFNLQRFFDDTNAPGIGEPVLTATAFANRLAKTGAAICGWVKAPDILGVVEVENLDTLTQLANYINGNCASAPAYAPYLQEGNDVGGIDVGFLVSNRGVRAGVSRVQVASVTQYGKDTEYGTSPLGCVPDTAGCTSSLLNDRPSLVLRAAVNFTNGRIYPLTVIVNHLRSLNGNDDPVDGRVRYKRAEQAVELAKLVNGIQTGNPSEKVVLVGDFNAFPFNDGYVDVMGIVTGHPAAEDEVVEYRASPLATPLVLGDELTADPAQRYSYVFGGNAQTLDHAVVNEVLVNDPAVVGLTVEHARINGDFRVAHYGEFNPPYTTENPPLRVSDHDPVRLKIQLTELSTADLSLSVSAPQPPGRGVAYSDTLTLRNDGPVAAIGARLHLYLQTTDFTVMTVQAPAGWSCRSSTPHYTYDCTASAPVAAGAQIVFKVNQRDSRSHSTSNPYRLEAQVQATTLDLLQDNNEAVQVNQ